MILLPPGAGPILQFAAEELQRTAPWAAQATIAIGPIDWAPEAAGLGPRHGPGHPEGFLLVGEGGRYALCAKTERGALYAVYAFLERLGARWPHPGRSIEPEDGTLPVLDEMVEPSYDLRGTYLAGPTDTDEVMALIAWSARRGLNAAQVESREGLDQGPLQEAASMRGLDLTFGPLEEAVHTAGRCFKHSLGNPYSCTVNPPLFRQIAGKAVAAEPYADLRTLGRPANLCTVIRQDLEDYFRESYRAFYFIHNGPLSWWTCPLNFDVYARTLWDLNTDVAEVMVDHAAGDDDLERTLGMAEEGAAAALRACDTPEHHVEAVANTAKFLPVGSLERAIHTADWAGAIQALLAMPPHQRGRFGDEVFLPHLRRRISDAASR